jgi:hypothetical protein
MKNPRDVCPVCWNRVGGTSRRAGDNGPIILFDCELCGVFGVASGLIQSHDQLSTEIDRLTAPKRAVLIQTIRRATHVPNSETYILTLKELSAILTEGRLPSPSEQATNIIRYIGDHVTKAGLPLLDLPLGFATDIGAINLERAAKVLEQLIERGVVSGMVQYPLGMDPLIDELDLTLEGWAQYEDERRGRYFGKYGFVALQFDDAILDPFLKDHVKPGVKQRLGYDLVDLRELAQPGIIDNLMRIKIRDAAFVLIDLTHDNRNAFWEAGFAEGLGKPVLYICERKVFSARARPFNTSHLTAVLWEAHKPVEFVDELVATLRRAPNLSFEI